MSWSVSISCLRNAMSVYMLVPQNIDHGSYSMGRWFRKAAPDLDLKGWGDLIKLPNSGASRASLGDLQPLRQGAGMSHSGRWGPGIFWGQRSAPQGQ